jgi:hypothetical protein
VVDDPARRRDFLAERARVRDALEHAPGQEVSTVLSERYRILTDEFLRRARLSWGDGK